MPVDGQKIGGGGGRRPGGRKSFKRTGSISIWHYVDILKEETINQLILVESVNIFQLNVLFNTDQTFN